jgi:hypothetical protein
MAKSHEVLVTYASAKILEAFDIMDLLLTAAPLQPGDSRRSVDTSRCPDLKAHQELMGHWGSQSDPLELLENLVMDIKPHPVSTTSTVDEMLSQLKRFQNFYLPLLNAAMEYRASYFPWAMHTNESATERSFWALKYKDLRGEVPRLKEELERGVTQLNLTSPFATAELVQTVQKFNETRPSSTEQQGGSGPTAGSARRSTKHDRARDDLLDYLHSIQDLIDRDIAEAPHLLTDRDNTPEHLMRKIAQAVTLFHGLSCGDLLPSTEDGQWVDSILRRGVLSVSPTNAPGEPVRSRYVRWPIAERIAGWMGYERGRAQAAYLIKKALWEPEVLEDNYLVIGEREVLCSKDKFDNTDSFLKEWFQLYPGQSVRPLYHESPWGCSVMIVIDTKIGPGMLILEPNPGWDDLERTNTV